LERINREVGRRTDVVGIFPDDQAVIRLTGALTFRAERRVASSGCYLSVESMALLADPGQPIADQGGGTGCQLSVTETFNGPVSVVVWLR
jgi:hypothetical protein